MNMIKNGWYMIDCYEFDKKGDKHKARVKNENFARLSFNAQSCGKAPVNRIIK